MEMLEPLQPYMHWIIFGGIGLVAGWLTGLLFGGGGLIRNLFVGILGAILGGALVNMKILQLPPAVTDITSQIPLGTEIFVAFIGAVIIVLLSRLLAR